MQEWAKKELCHIENYAERNAYYREALSVASQLIEPDNLNDPNRRLARVRFEQLYWADLAYVDESLPMAKAMVNFRRGLEAAEAEPDKTETWTTLRGSLLQLARTVQGETNRDIQRAPTCEDGASQGSAAKTSE